MKKLFAGIVLSLLLLCCSVLTVNAAVVSIDFDSLPIGDIPEQGIDLGDVRIFGMLYTGIGEDYLDGSSVLQKTIGVYPGVVTFRFDQSLFIDEIEVTLRTNAADAMLRAIGSEGTASFSLDYNTSMDKSFSPTFNGIGFIDELVFTGGESFITGLTYNTTPGNAPVLTPIPGALVLFGSGLLGLAGFRRK